jgi:hypothetical protein
MSILHQFIKHAADLPMWVNVPGMPFNIPVPGDRRERLPGSHKWVPIDVYERVSKGLEAGIPTEEIIRSEREHSDPGSHAFNAFIGGSVGGVGARLHGGEKAFEPIKDLLAKGLTRQSVGQTLKALPTGMKALPVAGAGAGALLSMLKHRSESGSRERSAREALRALLMEDISNQKALHEAAKQ